jgi:basic amino acid/polyamine antiporter, APA family
MNTTTSETGLVRALGIRGLAANIVNITIGGGIFALPAAVAAGLGAAAPLAYLVCVLAMALIVLCLAEAGSRVSLTGGPYAYVEMALGSFVGFLSGILLWLLGSFATAAVATVFTGSLVRLVPGLEGDTSRAVLLVALFGVLTWVNVRGVRWGAVLVELTTAAKLVPLALFVIVGAFFIEPANLAWTDTPSLGRVGETAIVLLFAFAGLETALMPSGEVKDPARTVPRAIFLAMAGITILYIAIQLVAQGILGDTMAQHRDAPLASAAGVAFGSAGSTLMLLGAVISTFGYVSGMTLSTPRALYAFGRDGFLPSVFARVHDRYHTPHVAIIVQSAIAVALAISGTFEKLAVLANISVLLLYLGCAVAAFELRRRDVRTEGAIPFRVPAGPVVPILAALVVMWLLAQAKRDELLWVGGALVAGAVVYLASGATGRRKGVEA